MNIKRKLEAIETLQDQLDFHIWIVFHKYVKLTNTHFNSPDTWTVEYDVINFVGSDGCRGCYDPMSLTIPIRFFTDTELAFKEFEETLIEQKKLSRKKESDIKQIRELNQLAKLKEKYPEK